MIGSFQNGLLIFFRTVSQILTAGIAITAFGLLLYALTFNLRDRVARSFALILFCVVVVFTAEAIGSASAQAWEINFWLRLQWVGIIMLPATYLHLSDALLATTGKPSRGRRSWAVRLVYGASLLCLLGVPFETFIGPLVFDRQPAPFLQPTLFTNLFVLLYLLVMGLSWYNFARAYRRTTTPTSRRRMRYLLTGALAPALGSFPYLLYGSGFANRHALIFWAVSAFMNFLLGGLVVVMAYSVAFFGVSWPDRVVKTRLFRWILRGPVTASVVLACATIVRRAGEIFGSSYSAFVPITVVGTILLAQYLITILSPLWDRLLFFSNDRDELDLLHRLEDRLLSRNDLIQFLEMILAAICDRLQAPGAYVAALGTNGLELVVNTGKSSFENLNISNGLSDMISQNGRLPALFQWGEDYLLPLFDDEEKQHELLGLCVICGVGRQKLEDEHLQALSILTGRAAKALQDRRTQQQLFRSIETLAPKVDVIQRMRAAGIYDRTNLLKGEIPLPAQDLEQIVKEALTHYWGGPKLTDSPLLQLRVVQNALENYEGNHANALRAILREAIERVRPEGERRFTAEWILYNILEMKFMEGRKVREIAMRLAMSEADLYRKQRIAIEAVAKAILEMEAQIQNNR